eukprot:CAMPEP_0182541788 /NCGR_PEP_ID=MMETSP1323-20130603/29158_1 /TAXON_ID=236787 /ORGANISM="Florenciella parvula, Strain RCC1693" /LENGTH=76 /DNA_ID=CAMNT_0024752589 /DNA_START=311 /DNA_END=542 /DNA_ORIENTATION=+
MTYSMLSGDPLTLVSHTLTLQSTLPVTTVYSEYLSQSTLNTSSSCTTLTPTASAPLRESQNLNVWSPLQVTNDDDE